MHFHAVGGGFYLSLIYHSLLRETRGNTRGLSLLEHILSTIKCFNLRRSFCIAVMVHKVDVIRIDEGHAEKYVEELDCIAIGHILHFSASLSINLVPFDG